MLSTGHGRKNDDADAVSVGIAALSRSRCRTSAMKRRLSDARRVAGPVARGRTVLSDAVAASGTTLTQLRGIGDLTHPPAVAEDRRRQPCIERADLTACD
jgi:hypothetical protein